ncbi:SWIM zinc finger family protein [Moraxella oblonga]|uniref:SWIM zinc finger family protein n=1 Tax=Moraxella oblonga TaxID=200413 RepID=UPI0008335723|nr:SWIM zinc finger family protein [Moraxella oblonga]
MTLDLQTIENIAPDQASLSSAKKLLSPSKWSGQGSCATTHTVWGECQGSGSKPYYVTVDVADIGYKCTCPSRKFPCKHALALMWRYVDDSSPFVPSPTPDWVSDWLGRRRKVSKSDTPEPTKQTQKSIALADSDTTDSSLLDPKKAEQAKKRAEKVKATTDAQITAGLGEFVGWLDDQVRLGMGVFLDKASERSRQISARLVDAKVGGLSSMVDELPSILHNTPKADRASVAFAIFGRWYLLCQAWQKNPDDPDVRRIITKAEDKETVLLGLPLSVVGAWLVVGEKVETRRDGLISHATYLVRLLDENLADENSDIATPTTAVLLDFQHPSGGVKRTTGKVGSVMAGRLVYYPSRVPFRAFFETVETKFINASTSYYDPAVKVADSDTLPPTPMLCSQKLATAYATQLTHLAWANEFLYTGGKGRLAKDERGRFWYINDGETILLKNNELSELVLSLDIESAFILWDGRAGELLSVQTKWGLLAC